MLELCPAQLDLILLALAREQFRSRGGVRKMCVDFSDARLTAKRCLLCSRRRISADGGHTNAERLCRKG
jgi:hypothetical protein